MYLTGNFGEILYIKLSENFLQSDETFKQDMIRSGNLYMQSSKDFRRKDRQSTTPRKRALKLE